MYVLVFTMSAAVAPAAVSAAFRLLAACRICAFRSPGPTNLPSLSTATWPEMNTSLAGPAIVTICVKPRGVINVSGLMYFFSTFVLLTFRFPAAVLQYLHLLDRDQPRAHHLVEHG